MKKKKKYDIDWLIEDQKKLIRKLSSAAPTNLMVKMWLPAFITQSQLFILELEKIKMKKYGEKR